ncbi:MAG TPA: type I methionyl aminopeptidase [Patescibacteria group bacterium]|nr:type I methionyl aminopeptidase [Patescibacteria group bacterium]
MVDHVKIERMKVAGKILGEVMDEVLDSIKPGISELEIDSLAEKLILAKGGKPGFKRVPGYKHTICISVNDSVVHGIPTKRLIKANDIVGIDCGVFYEGYHTDMAETIYVGAKKGDKPDPDMAKFLNAGKKAVFDAIRQVKTGNRVGHLSREMQKNIEGGGFSVVKSLVGHGVGRELHEPPEIPGYLAGSIENTPKLTEGQTIAIEIIYNQGKAGVVYSGEDDWTIVTEDGSNSGLFERTVLVTNKGPELITRRKSDKL